MSILSEDIKQLEREANLMPMVRQALKEFVDLWDEAHLNPELLPLNHNAKINQIRDLQTFIGKTS